MTQTTSEPRERTVVGNISLSLDGRTAGPGGEYDMGWVVPHALTDGARDHMVKITSTATTALLGRKNYQGFASFWPAVAQDEAADPRDRAFARWLNAVDKVVFSTTLTRPTGTTPASPRPIRPPRSGSSAGSREATSSSWPAAASSAACWRPGSWTGSASPCAPSCRAVVRACSAMARPARPGR